METKRDETTIAEFALKELPGNDLKINRVVVEYGVGGVKLTMYDMVSTTNGVVECTTVNTPLEAWELFRHYSDEMLEQILR